MEVHTACIAPIAFGFLQYEVRATLDALLFYILASLFFLIRTKLTRVRQQSNPESDRPAKRPTGTRAGRGRNAKCIAQTASRRSLTGWISPAQRIIGDVRIRVQLKRWLIQQPRAEVSKSHLHVLADTNRITADVPARFGIVVSVPVVEQPRLAIEVLARQYSDRPLPPGGALF